LKSFKPPLNAYGIEVIAKMSVVGQCSELHCRRCGFSDPDVRLVGCSCLLHVVRSIIRAVRLDITNAEQDREVLRSIMNVTSHVIESCFLIGSFLSGMSLSASCTLYKHVSLGVRKVIYTMTLQSNFALQFERSF
jgi:hypothetical protein